MEGWKLASNDHVSGCDLYLSDLSRPALVVVRRYLLVSVANGPVAQLVRASDS